jgi:hypothetical protein
MEELKFQSEGGLLLLSPLQSKKAFSLFDGCNSSKTFKPSSHSSPDEPHSTLS